MTRAYINCSESSPDIRVVLASFDNEGQVSSAEAFKSQVCTLKFVLCRKSHRHKCPLPPKQSHEIRQRKDGEERAPVLGSGVQTRVVCLQDDCTTTAPLSSYMHRRFKAYQYMYINVQHKMRTSTMTTECSMLKEQSKNNTKRLEHHTYIVVTTSFMLRQSS